MTVRQHITITGQVQGVGLRWRVKHAASIFSLTGWVRNLECSDMVELELQGEQTSIDSLLELVGDSEYIEFGDVRRRNIPLEDSRTFEVLDY